MLNSLNSVKAIWQHLGRVLSLGVELALLFILAGKRCVGRCLRVRVYVSHVGASEFVCVRNGCEFFEGFITIFVLCCSYWRNAPKPLSLIHLAILCFLPTLLEWSKVLSFLWTILTRSFWAALENHLWILHVPVLSPRGTSCHPNGITTLLHDDERNKTSELLSLNFSLNKVLQIITWT